jgi:hypothetical protein
MSLAAMEQTLLAAMELEMAEMAPWNLQQPAVFQLLRLLSLRELIPRPSPGTAVTAEQLPALPASVV